MSCVKYVFSYVDQSNLYPDARCHLPWAYPGKMASGFTEGNRPIGISNLSYKNVSKQDVKEYDIIPLKWCTVAAMKSTRRASLTTDSIKQ